MTGADPERADAGWADPDRSPPDQPDPDKAVLRARALAARRAGGDQAAMDRHLSALLGSHAGAAVAGYWPMRGEADPRGPMAAHAGPLLLPVVAAPATPLVFRLWRGGALVPGPHGTAHPPEDAPAMRPDLVILPLAGFDAAGNRLGYGGGYYDRSLAQLRGQGPLLAVGLAFACQELPAIPAGPFDQPLDLIVTEAGLRRPWR